MCACLGCHEVSASLRKRQNGRWVVSRCQGSRKFIAQRVQHSHCSTVFFQFCQLALPQFQQHIRQYACSDISLVDVRICRLLSLLGVRPSLMANPNGCFITSAGVFDPGNGRIGPACLEVPPAILREASNAACHFFRISF